MSEIPDQEMIEARLAELMRSASGVRLGALDPTTRQAISNDLVLLKRRQAVWRALGDVAQRLRYEILEESLEPTPADAAKPKEYWAGQVRGVYRLLGTLDALTDEAEEEAEREAFDDGDRLTPGAIAAVIGGGADVTVVDD